MSGRRSMTAHRRSSKQYRGAAICLRRPSRGAAWLRTGTGLPLRRYRWLRSAAAAIVLAVVAVAFVYWRTPATAPSADRPSIAVLPFTIGSADTDQGYLSEGLAEDLTTNLSRFGELFVVAHQSAKQFKDKPFDASQVGRELGVRYLLTGNVRRDASRVRITAQLVNAATAHQLWTERARKRTPPSAGYYGFKIASTKVLPNSSTPSDSIPISSTVATG